MTTTLSVMSPLDMRNAYLRTVRCELIARGVVNPNVTPKSDYAVKAAALSQMLAPCMANAVAAAEVNMPDTCTGDRLERWLAAYGLSFRAAQGSSGQIILNSSTSTYVGAGTRLVDDQGQFYEVTATIASCPNGGLISISAIDTGASTNRTAGTVLQWVVPPTYANPKALVATGGLSDGADADTEDTARDRLLKRLRYSEGGGNWAQTIAWAEDVIAGTTAYDYPALNGPATYGLWVLGELRWTGTKFSRQISDASRELIAAYVKAQKPMEAFLTMPSIGSDLSVCDQLVDVSLALALPSAIGAGGIGGGWVDTAPWPILAGSATRVQVSAVTDATHITVTSNDASTTPVPSTIVNGTTQIAWFDPSGYPGNVIKTSTIINHSGTVGNVVLSLNPQYPLTGIAVGDYIFPSCENAEIYAKAWLAAVGAMGPGEWSSNATVLVNARRQPSAVTTATHTLSYTQRKAIEQSSSEVLNADYLYTSATTTNIPANTTTAAPNVIVPGRRLGFYLPK